MNITKIMQHSKTRNLTSEGYIFLFEKFPDLNFTKKTINTNEIYKIFIKLIDYIFIETYTYNYKSLFIMCQCTMHTRHSRFSFTSLLYS